MGVTTRQRAMRSTTANGGSVAEDIAAPTGSKLAADKSAHAARDIVETKSTSTAGTRRKSMGNTFLSGMNLACQTVDPLSFPDPPTPARPTEPLTTVTQKPVATGEQSRRRRISSPSPPLKDLTNNDGDTVEREAGKRERRRTLLPPADDRHDSKKDPQLNLSRTAKRKKRKSILLPSEMSPDEKECVIPSSYTRVVSSETSSGDLPGVLSESKLKGPVVRANEVYRGDRSLVRMVREYCALPDSARFASDQSRHIEALSGYSIVPSYQRMLQSSKEMNASSNGMSGIPSKTKGGSDPEPMSLNEFKRALLFKMGPVVDLMERSKKEEAKMIEEGTRCRVEKQERRQDGICPYRYRDTLTGKEVPKEEYEARYMGAIQSRKKERARTALDGGVTEPILDRSICGAEANRSPLTNLRRSNPSPSFNDDSSEQRKDSQESSSVIRRYSGQTVAEALAKSKASCSPTSHSGSDMSECLSPLSSDHSPQDLCTEEEKSPTENSAAKIDGKMIKSNTSLSEKDASCPHSNMPDDAKPCCQTVGSSSSRERLPFPSRENSSDPAVAAAERKLWAAIDAALATYSEEILTIKRQRNGKQASK